VKIVKQLEANFPNLRLLQHGDNRGRGAARRSGQNATQSPWIGFVDADIVVPTYWLSRCLEELSEIDGVSGIAQPDGDCSVIWRICQPTLRSRPGSAEITGNNVLFSQKALNLVPFTPDAKLGEDFRQAKKMIQKGLQLRTIKDLVVEHRESKTYWKAISWMLQSGVDATSLLFEFRIIRMPDLAWLTWSAGLLIIAAATGYGEMEYWFSMATFAGLTFVVNALFVCSRFTPRPHSLRFLAALIINLPMMVAYLVGRSVGLFRVPRPLRRS
jgi:cellulose synthase/poly-beta-1,6-N-acetylglucosamine synthase-like glycosyltransferase